MLGLGLGGYWFYGVLFPGDETLIRRTFENVAAAASIKPEDGTFAKMAAVSELLGYFAQDVSISLEGVPVEAREINGLAELRELAKASRVRVKSAQVSFSDILVKVDPGGETASARLIGRAQFSGDDPPWYQELKVSLRKVDGTWKIAHAEAAKGLTM